MSADKLETHQLRIKMDKIVNGILKMQNRLLAYYKKQIEKLNNLKDSGIEYESLVDKGLDIVVDMHQGLAKNISQIKMIRERFLNKSNLYNSRPKMERYSHSNFQQSTCATTSSYMDIIDPTYPGLHTSTLLPYFKNDGLRVDVRTNVHAITCNNPSSKALDKTFETFDNDIFHNKNEEENVLKQSRMIDQKMFLDENKDRKISLKPNSSEDIGCQLAEKKTTRVKNVFRIVKENCTSFFSKGKKSQLRNECRQKSDLEYTHWDSEETLGKRTSVKQNSAHSRQLNEASSLQYNVAIPHQQNLAAAVQHNESISAHHNYQIPPINFILFGVSGNGKSATGNSILSRNCFKINNNITNHFSEVVREESILGDQIVSVLDVPGLNSSKASTYIHEALEKCDYTFHAMLLILKYGNRFTAQERSVVNLLKSFLGPNVFADYGIIIVTHGDLFNEYCDDFNSWSRTQTGELASLFKECNYRCLLFDNYTSHNYHYLDKLLSNTKNLKVYTKLDYDRYQTERDKFAVSLLVPEMNTQVMKRLEELQNKFKKSEECSQTINFTYFIDSLEKLEKEIPVMEKSTRVFVSLFKQEIQSRKKLVEIENFKSTRL